MKRLLFALVMFTAVGCSDKKNNPICAIESAVSASVSVALAGPLQCKHPEVIKLDVRAALDKVDGKLCEMSDKALLGPVCGLLADRVIDLIVGKALPAAWGCSADGAKDAVKAIVVGACNSVI